MRSNLDSRHKIWKLKSCDIPDHWPETLVLMGPDPLYALKCYLEKLNFKNNPYWCQYFYYSNDDRTLQIFRRGNIFDRLMIEYKILHPDYCLYHHIYGSFNEA